LLTFLPRLTSWGSHHKGRELDTVETDVTDNVTQTLKQDLNGYQMRFEIARSPQKKKTRRKKISYWSDEEAVAIKASQYESWMSFDNIFCILIDIQQPQFTKMIQKTVLRQHGVQEQLLPTRMILI
jgi:hypothetical protein